MSKQALDLSFERAGRPLLAWLPELVADDAAARLAAGEAIQAMQTAVPSIHTDLLNLDWKGSGSLQGHSERFRQAVRAAFSSPEFPTRDFVRRLIAQRIALSDDWLARVQRDQDKPPGVAEERHLATLGPCASACLPALERLRAARASRDDDASGSLDPDEPLDRAFLAIRGEL